MIPAALRERLARERRITITVKALPKASKDEVVGLLDDGSLKVKVTAPPDKGKANAAICELLADEFNVAKRNVRIVRGGTSHTKQIEISL
jgi:uncharacterized protein (TIGR00251 family)